MRHAPPVLNNQETVQPPYYLRVLLSPPVIAEIDDLSDLLARSARLTMTDNLGARRHVRGLILRAMKRTGPFGRSNVVELQVYPTLWATALSEKSRVWRNVDSVAVLRQILAEYRPEVAEVPTVVDQALNGQAPEQPPTRECVIQWAESDFAFVSRLLERDGIYYFFTHEENQVNLHLADMRTPYSEGFVPHRHLALEATLGPGSELFDDHASFLSHHVQTTPRSYRVADYNPATADTVLDYRSPSEGMSALEVYDYPGEFASLRTAPTVAGRRHTAIKARQSVIAGASRCPFLTAGHAVTLPSFHADAENNPFRVVEVVHELVRDGSGKPYYRNWFEALDGDSHYAPTQRTPVPAAHGTHNATVVSGLPEETVDVDEYSRALVLFRWDTSLSPVRARLGQPWAGGKHGVSVLPRAGDEVLVGFIQGNTERPVILTALHNSATPKKYDPTQMEENDLEGQVNKGAQRQNRYATAIHNSSGNSIYFNDTTNNELVKIDAFKDFVLEVGHKVTSKPADTMTGTILSIRPSNQGLGYTTPPGITIQGGDGTAKATANLNNEGRVVSVTVDDGGNDYQSTDPVIVAPAPNATGSIKSIFSNADGSGYDPAAPPSVSVSSFEGTGAAFEVIVEDDGSISRIDVTDGGRGYSTSDPVFIDPPPSNSNGTTETAEIGRVESENAELEIDQIRGGASYSTDRTGTHQALDEQPPDEPDHFLRFPEQRGNALIRSYGDFTLHVGKLATTHKEYSGKNHQKELSKDAENSPSVESLDQDKRGSLNVYVMGGTTWTVRGSFAYVEHPVTGQLIAAEWKRAWLGIGRTTTVARSQADSYTMSSSTSFGLSTGFDYTSGVSSSIGASGSIGNSMSAGISAGFSILNGDFEGDTFTVNSFFGRKHFDPSQDLAGLRIFLNTDPKEMGIEKTSYKASKKTHFALVSAVTGVASALPIPFLGVYHDDNDYTKDVMNFYATAVSTSAQTAGVLAWALGLILVGILYTRRVTSKSSSGSIFPTIELSPTSGIRLSYGMMQYININSYGLRVCGTSFTALSPQQVNQPSVSPLPPPPPG
jgi:type VI secretion system secreted protein VgrG